MKGVCACVFLCKTFCLCVAVCVCICMCVSERQTPICPGNALKPDLYSGGKGRQLSYQGHGRAFNRKFVRPDTTRNV